VWPSHAEIVDEQERDGAELREVLLARAGELSVRELVEEPVGFTVEDTMALLDHGEADGLGQVALARPGLPKKQSVFMVRDEAPGGQLEDEPAVHLGVEVEVEGVESLPLSVRTLFEGGPPVPRSGSAMVGLFSPQGFCSIDSAFSRIQSMTSGS
jgi:hypothetical protein